MTLRRVLILALIVVVFSVAFWKSPFSIGLKLKYGMKNNDGPILLEASDGPVSASNLSQPSCTNTRAM